MEPADGHAREEAKCSQASLSARKSLSLAVMVVALCVVVVITCSWRPLLAHLFYIRLRASTPLAGDMLGSDLDSWRQDGVMRYLETAEGGRLLCAMLLREIDRLDSSGADIGLNSNALLFLCIRDECLYVIRYNEVYAWNLALNSTVSLKWYSCGNEARLKTLFKNAALLQSEVSNNDEAMGMAVTINTATDPVIPECVRKDIQMWHMVQIRKTTQVLPGLRLSQADLDSVFNEFRSVMELHKLWRSAK